MRRCKTCVMPDTRPDTPFIDGECAACVAYRNRKQMPADYWKQKDKELRALLERHDMRVLVPSSGGKDSHYQVSRMLELGAEVSVVTATTCHLTYYGRMNIDNLALHAHQTIEVTPNLAVRARLNRAGLSMVGDISWPEHVAIFTTPFNVALQTGHTLLMYGENPQQEYGGPMGSEQAVQLTRRWVTEFGGQLGLRPADLIDSTELSESDMAPYKLDPGVLESNIEAHFLGAYEEWDSHRNAEAAEAMGMIHVRPCTANWWRHENLDNAQTGIHDHFMYRKYGFGRGCQQISVDVRRGLVKRDFALQWVKEYDGLFPRLYAGVPTTDVLERADIPNDELEDALKLFTNRAIFPGYMPPGRDWL